MRDGRFCWISFWFGVVAVLLIVSPQRAFENGCSLWYSTYRNVLETFTRTEVVENEVDFVTPLGNDDFSLPPRRKK